MRDLRIPEGQLTASLSAVAPSEHSTGPKTAEGLSWILRGYSRSHIVGAAERDMLPGQPEGGLRSEAQHLPVAAGVPADLSTQPSAGSRAATHDITVRSRSIGTLSGTDHGRRSFVDSPRLQSQPPRPQGATRVSGRGKPAPIQAAAHTRLPPPGLSPTGNGKVVPRNYA